MINSTVLNFIDQPKGLNINPDMFIEWLKDENNCEGDSYNEQVTSMCEFSCLYLAMKYVLSSQSENLRLVEGKFNNWGHWWVEYKDGDVTYILDLTVSQFISDAPKLGVIIADYDNTPYSKDKYCDYSYSLKEYCDSKKAFMFYKIPKDLIKK